MSWRSVEGAGGAACVYADLLSTFSSLRSTRTRLAAIWAAEFESVAKLPTFRLIVLSRVFCFGIGLDPLWLGTDLLAAAVIESDVFDEVFGDVVPVNAEGRVVIGHRKLAVEGIPFIEDHVQRFLTSQPMGPGGAACLMLAWQRRKMILG